MADDDRPGPRIDTEVAKAPEFDPNPVVNHLAAEEAREQEKFPDALAYYREAIVGYTADNNPGQVAEAHLGKSLTLRRMAGLAQSQEDKAAFIFGAKDAAYTGLQLALKVKAEGVIPRGFQQVALIHTQVEEYPVAKEMFERALHAHSTHAPKRIAELGFMRSQYGDMLCAMGKYQEGLDELQRAKQEIEMHADTVGGGPEDPRSEYVWLVWNSGVLLKLTERNAEIGRADEALGFLEQAKQVVAKIRKDYPDKTLRWEDLKAVEDKLRASGMLKA